MTWGLTPSISEIMWVKNMRAIVVCGFLNEIIKKPYPEYLKKNCGCRLEVAC